MPTTRPKRTIIMGAAGRDFHDFNTLYRDNPDYEIVAFTATQIPDIAGRKYPPELAGKHYPEGIPIYDEGDLTKLIKDLKIDEVAFAYSDVSYETVMHKASMVMAAGADFRLNGPRGTMIESSKPVIAVCAVRTGCGKSQTTRKVSEYLKEMGKRIAVVRHPMPYGDLTRQVCQRFASLKDMDKHECTIEEREEYEPHIRRGNLVFAGVDYEKIIRAAESEADVILWDGGNNDMPFYKPALFITVADPHRAGHELRYHPGEVNLRMADVVVINKVGTARPENVKIVEDNIRAVNPGAIVVRANSPVTVEDPAAIRGKKVLLVEDGPTLTHGEMTFGAAYVAASNNGAGQIVDPRPYAVGSIKDTFAKYKHLTEILPAMGYGHKQMAELEATIRQVPCDLVLVGTPIDLAALIKIDKPNMRVFYELKEEQPGPFKSAIQKAVG
jgi:predicted GTPase